MRAESVDKDAEASQPEQDSTEPAEGLTEVLEREERRRRLVDFLDYMDELYGPPTDEEMAKTDKKIEAMWARYEDYLSRQSS